MLSATEAAEACGVSLRTMSRRLNAGKVPGAERKGNSWAVPLEGLLAAGFHPYRSEPAAAAVVPDPAAVERVAELEKLLGDERHRRELAETREQGLRELVEQLRGDLDYQRALMPGTAGGVSMPAPGGDVPASTEPERKRPRWWSRRS